MPPLPPPSGISTTAVFQVIQAAKRPHGVNGLVWVKADAALGRPTRIVILHAKALEGLIGAIVHLDRDGEVEFTHRHAQKSMHGGRETRIAAASASWCCAMANGFSLDDMRLHSFVYIGFM